MSLFEQYDNFFRIVLIGNYNVGKTSLLYNYAGSGNFENSSVIDFRVRFVEVNGKKNKLIIFDPCRSTYFKEIARSYFRQAFGVIFIYDITDYNSFLDLKLWLAGFEKHPNLNPPKMLIGNKADLDGQRKVTSQEGQEFATSMNASFIETSAKNSQNVETAFMTLTNEILTHLAEIQLKLQTQIALQQKTSKVNQWC